MKRKIGIFLVIMLLCAYIIPAIAINAEPNKIMITLNDPDDYRLTIEHLNDGRLPPNPGEVPENFVFEFNNIQREMSSPEKNAVTFDEIIVDILQELDETLILDYLQDLTSFGPKVTGSPSCQAAGTYIYNEFISYGLEARYDPWNYYSYSGNNIEGTLYGVDEESDEIYIISAHYDTVSSSPGADDDGSGTAAVLAAANLLSQYEFNHTIRFVAFDGEEQGLLGSYRYAEDAYGNGDNIVGVLNGDMIGFAQNPTQASYIKIYEDTSSQWITDFTEDVSQEYYDYIELTIVPSGPAYNSDHASFWDFNYDAIMYHEYLFNTYYHSSQDTIANMDTDYSTRVSKLILATLAELAELSDLNTPPEIPTITGPSSGYDGEELTFAATSTDFDEDMIYYQFDWGNGDITGWFGPYDPGETMYASNIWNEVGNYEVKVRAMDTNDSESDWSEPHDLTIIENTPPGIPAINAPIVGRTGKPFSLTLSAIDPEGHDVNFYIRWGDGTTEYWLGPYSSGEEATFSHTYTTGGSMTIVVKAMDEFGKEGQQDQTKIYILKSKAVIINPLVNQIILFLKNNFPRLAQIIGF